MQACLMPSVLGPLSIKSQRKGRGTSWRREPLGSAGQNGKKGQEMPPEDAAREPGRDRFQRRQKWMKNPEAIEVRGNLTRAGVLGLIYGEASIYLLPNTVQLNDHHTATH